jgi:hypothetical protein
MEIVIDRFGSYHHAVSGRLLIDGQHVCDTLEEDVHCLPEGEYALQRNSKLALPYYIRLADAVSIRQADAVSIRQADAVSGVDSRVDSRVSFSRGNGIHGWRNHCIIVGECLHLGFLIHSEECYDLLIARIRMQFVRHHAVVVKISRSPDFLEVA